MNPHEMKQAERKERHASAAARLRSESEAAFAAAAQAVEHIPFGQPILVGHHSERRHRRDLERHDQRMRKAIELQKAADEAARRAATESNAISSDDPDAPDKLRERIAKLERNQEIMVAANKIYRARIGDEEKVAKLISLGLSEKAARNGLLPDFAGRIGFPGYALTNNSGNLRRLKDRLAAIESNAAEAAQPDIVGKGWTVREDKEDNRLLILFDAIPDATLRGRLKQHGFRWSPSRKAWVRMLNNGARFAAQVALQIP